VLRAAAAIQSHVAGLDGERVGIGIAARLEAILGGR
jgi:hypothetical protein